MINDFISFADLLNFFFLLFVTLTSSWYACIFFNTSFFPLFHSALFFLLMWADLHFVQGRMRWFGKLLWYIIINFSYFPACKNMWKATTTLSGFAIISLLLLHCPIPSMSVHDSVFRSSSLGSIKNKQTKAHCLGITQKSCKDPLLNSQIYCIHMQVPIVTHKKCPSIKIYIHNLYPFTHYTTMSPYLHIPLCHSTISALLLHHQQHQTENLYSPLCLSFIRVTMRSRSSSCSPSPCSCLAGGR